MKGPHVIDVPVLLSVWVLCVATDWSTGTKIALNVAAVTVLCLKEVLLHRRLQQAALTAAGAASTKAVHRSLAAA